MGTRQRHQNNVANMSVLYKEPAGPNAVLFAVPSGGQIADCFQGSVWKAYLHSSSVAVKVYKNRENFDETKRGFLKEVEILHQTNACPFTIQCLGWFSYGAHLGVVLEYAECGTLYNLMCLRTEITIGTDLCNRILHQILVAINYMHNISSDQRAVHKDIKSANVLLTGELRAKLADFAGSQIQSLTGDWSNSNLEENERNIITYEYAPPEVLRHPRNKISSSADMHAFGVIAWEMYHRRRAYGQYRGDSRACIDAILRGEILEVENFESKQINDGLGVLIQWCLGTTRHRVSPDERPTAKMLIDAWHDLLPYSSNNAMAQASAVVSRLRDEDVTMPKNTTDLMTAMGLYDERYHREHRNNVQHQQGMAIHHSVRSEITPVKLWNLTAQYFLNGRFQINQRQRNGGGRNIIPDRVKQVFKRGRKPVVVVLGDEGVGKHWMINLYFRKDYYVYKKHSKITMPTAPNKTVDVSFEIGLNDKLKKIDAIVFCFAVDNYTSFSSLLSKWAKQVDERFPGVSIPCIVVGMKGDLRSGFDTAPRQACEAAATALGAEKYLECSSRDGTNIKEIIEKAAKLALTTHT